MHIDVKDYSFAHSGVAVSDNPAGPYKYLGSFQPNGQMARDMTLFKDDDNKAYLIYSSENNNTMHVCLLSDDYLSPTKTWSRILIDRNREAPALFKNKGQYYLITSACTGWSPNPATYAVASQPLGPWQEYDNPCTGEEAELHFNHKALLFCQLKEKLINIFSWQNRWNKVDLENSKYVWLPLSIKNGKIEITSPLSHSAQ
jgi:hypothetical protein